jgi:hypothetical protein
MHINKVTGNLSIVWSTRMKFNNVIQFSCRGMSIHWLSLFNLFIFIAIINGIAFYIFIFFNLDNC